MTPNFDKYIGRKYLNGVIIRIYYLPGLGIITQTRHQKPGRDHYSPPSQTKHMINRLILEDLYKEILNEN